MDVLERTSGTLVNVLTVLAGTGLGLLVRGTISERMTRTVFQVLGLVTLAIGLEMAAGLSRVRSGPVPGIVLALVALAAGALVGEALGLEERLDAWGERLRARVGGSGSFAEGLVTAALLFCVGPLTIVGSIQNGLDGDSRALLVKATLDGIASVVLAGAHGAGVGLAAIVVLVVQGSLSLGAGALAGLVPDPGNDPRVLLVSATGGLMIVGLAVNLLASGLGIEGARMRVAAMLPALLLAPVVYHVAGLIPA